MWFIFASTCQVIGWEDHLRNDLHFIEWDIKLLYLSNLLFFFQFMITTMSVTAGMQVRTLCHDLHLSLVFSRGVHLKLWLQCQYHQLTGVSTVPLCLTDNIILMVSCSKLKPHYMNRQTRQVFMAPSKIQWTSS